MCSTLSQPSRAKTYLDFLRPDLVSGPLAPAGPDELGWCLSGIAQRAVMRVGEDVTTESDLVRYCNPTGLWTGGVPFSGMRYF